MSTILPFALPVLQDMASFAWGHVKDSIGHPKGSKEAAQIAVLQALPSLPTLQEALGAMPSLAAPAALAGPALAVPESLQRTEPPAAPVPPRETRPADVAGSYAEEIEDLSIACMPCKRSHNATMAVAAEYGAQAEDPESAFARSQWARVAGEGLVMVALDFTPEKLARSRPADRAIVEAMMPRELQLIEQTPKAPKEIVLAWASIDEAIRFARSPRAKPQDRAQILIRVRLWEDMANYSERMHLGPAAFERLIANLPEAQQQEARGVPGDPDRPSAPDLMRQARHRLVGSEYDLEDLTFAAAKLEAATVALTPPIPPEQAAALAKRYRELRNETDRRILAAIAARRTAGTAAKGAN